MKYICRIGNNAQNDLVITDRTAADFHAHLILDNEDRMWIKDLSTKYGTRVNGEKITKSELSYSDEVRIGFTIIDWIGVRNKWIEGQAAHIGTIAWSEPLKQVSTNDSLKSEISQLLANEAVKSKEEYNPNEFSSSSKVEQQRSTEQESDFKKSPASNDKVNHADKSSEIHSGEKTNAEISIENFESNQDLGSIKLSDNSTEVSLEKTGDSEIILNSKDVDSTDLTQTNSEDVENSNFPNESKIDEQIIDSIEQVNEISVSNLQDDNSSETTKNAEIQNQQEEEKNIKDSQKINVVSKPIVFPTSTGIRFDYRGSAARAENSESKPIVRVVAKTNVANYETPELRPIFNSDQKLVFGVIALVISMLLIGWFLASLGS